MAPGSGIHLNCTGPGSPDALSVEGRFLIALDNADGVGGAQLSNGAFQAGKSCPIPESSSGSAR